MNAPGLRAEDLPMSAASLSDLNKARRAAGQREVDDLGRAVPDFPPPANAPVPGWADWTEAWESDGPDEWQRGHHRVFEGFDLFALQYANRDGSVEYADDGVPILSFAAATVVPEDMSDLLETARRISRDLATMVDLLAAEQAVRP